MDELDRFLLEFWRELFQISQNPLFNSGINQAGISALLG